METHSILFPVGNDNTAWLKKTKYTFPAIYTYEISVFFFLFYFLFFFFTMSSSLFFFFYTSIFAEP